MPSHSKRPRDLNHRAADIVAAATDGEAVPEEAEAEATPEPTAEERHNAAVTMGRLGGQKGGKARARILTPEQRQAIAKKAAAARWRHQKSI